MYSPHNALNSVIPPGEAPNAPLGPPSDMGVLPCKVYWDAIYDLGGTRKLTGEMVPLGGTWPWFFRVCPRQLREPKIYTQWVDYLSPTHVLDTEHNPDGHKVKDLLCTSRHCEIDREKHPIKLMGPPCQDPDHCEDCPNLVKIDGGKACVDGCRPGQQWFTRDPATRRKYLSGECKVGGGGFYSTPAELCSLQNFVCSGGTILTHRLNRDVVLRPARRGPSVRTSMSGGIHRCIGKNP